MTKSIFPILLLYLELLLCLTSINGMARSDKMLQPHLLEDQNPKAILNLSKIKNRMSKQFKDNLFSSSEAVNNDANVAMSLVDALQNWADALEAQISMMRVEVLELKTSNRKLTEEVSDLKSENVQTKTQLETLGQSFMEFKGENKGVQEDIRVMSSSFGDFIDHFNDFTVSVTVNFTGVNKTMEVMKENMTTYLEDNKTIEKVKNSILEELKEIDYVNHDIK